jgi:hypothetical protein
MTKQIDGLTTSVSMSSDGTTVAIGAPIANNYKGLTRIYKLTGQAWVMYQIDGLTDNENSGFSVSLSSDGTTVAIGAPNASSFKGLTRIYKWNSSSWAIMDKQIDGLAMREFSGFSVSLSSDGTTVAIGAPYAANSNADADAGATRIYKWNNSSWVIMDKPIDGLTAGEQSGTSVSLSSNGTTVAIGAPYALSTTGTTRIYKWNNSSWIMLAQINGLTAGEHIGTRVSLSSDGITVAIGAPYALSTTGTTRIYKWNNSSWIMLAQINGLTAGEQSGTSVSLSSNGTTVAIGAPYANYYTGTTRIYKLNNSSWILLGSQINGLAANELLGTSVSLSSTSNGTTVAIGAPNANATRIYKYQL